jgi:hypothetical protein
MSESQDSPTLPGEPGGEMKTGKRPTAKQLDERSAEMETRQMEMDEREQELLAREKAAFDGTLPDRTSIDEGAERENTQANAKSIRRDIGRSKRLDADKYLEKYPEMQLMWINDLSGDVQRWIDEGAEPVPVLSKATKVFEGITDKAESKWVRSIGGDDGMGGHFWVYLLMVNPEIYDEVKLAPQRARQELIRRAMKIGSDSSAMDGTGPRLPTYAPNLPTGDERGIDITRETVAPPER